MTAEGWAPAPLADCDLSGVLVVALEQAVAAPFCTCALADGGARVIKIERPEGDFARWYDTAVNGLSANFVWLNRGKESVCLDIKDPADAELFAGLLARADVFVQNLAPGAAERAGFGSDALRAKYPRLITCDISGYGEDGPYAGMKAYDLLVQGESGLASITGNAEDPSRVGVSVCDIGAGMYAHAAILQALYARERTGAGRAIRVSLFDAVADWMNVPYLQFRYGGKGPQRVGLNHATIAPYGAYACQDGTLLISIQNEREWASLCERILGDARLATDPRFATNSLRVEHRGELDTLVRGAFVKHTLATLENDLHAANIAFGRFNDVAALTRHPQLRLRDVETAAGRIELIAPPARSDAVEPALARVPSVGEHTAAIRNEFGSRGANDKLGSALSGDNFGSALAGGGR